MKDRIRFMIEYKLCSIREFITFLKSIVKYRKSKFDRKYKSFIVKLYFIFKNNINVMINNINGEIVNDIKVIKDVTECLKNIDNEVQQFREVLEDYYIQGNFSYYDNYFNTIRYTLREFHCKIENIYAKSTICIERQCDTINFCNDIKKDIKSLIDLIFNSYSIKKE